MYSVSKADLGRNPWPDFGKITHIGYLMDILDIYWMYWIYRKHTSCKMTIRQRKRKRGEVKFETLVASPSDKSRFGQKHDITEHLKHEALTAMYTEQRDHNMSMSILFQDFEILHYFKIPFLDITASMKKNAQLWPIPKMSIFTPKSKITS